MEVYGGVWRLMEYCASLWTSMESYTGCIKKRSSNFDVLLGVQYLTYRNTSCVVGKTRLLAFDCRCYCKI